MSGHGHVIPNADGSRARCGGPGLCAVCSREATERHLADMRAIAFSFIANADAG